MVTNVVIFFVLFQNLFYLQVIVIIAFVCCHMFFSQEVVEVTKGVWVAIGFGLANSIMVEGDSGVIIGVYCDFFVCLCLFIATILLTASSSC